MKEKFFAEERVIEGKRVLFVTNGIVEIMCGADFGPRIFKFNLVGKESPFYFNAADFRSDKNEYRHYGGHRLWQTPETAGVSSCPDNDPVEVKIGEDSVTLTQKNGAIPLVRSLTFRLKENRVTVLHELTNKGMFPVETSLWGITQFKPDGYAVVPTSTTDTGLHYNRTFAVWPYTDMQDRRLHFGNRYVTVTASPDDPKALKIGTNSESGYAAFLTNGGQTFVKKFAFPDGGEEFADNGANVEVYACGDFLELETLSPLVYLDMGETCEHYEEWALYERNFMPKPTDEDALFTLFEEKGLEI